MHCFYINYETLSSTVTNRKAVSPTVTQACYSLSPAASAQ